MRKGIELSMHMIVIITLVILAMIIVILIFKGGAQGLGGKLRNFVGNITEQPTINWDRLYG